MRKVLVLAVLLLATTCFADSFQIEGTIKTVGTGNVVGSFAGTLDIDTKTGSLVNFYIPMPGLVGLSPLTFAPSNFLLVLVLGSEIHFTLDQRYELNLSIGKPLSGFTGPAFTGQYANTVGTNAVFYNLSGIIAPAVAPEPSSLLLMGSGLAGVFALRRKLFRGIVRRQR